VVNHRGLLSDLFKVKLAVETGEPAGESNEHFGQGWMDVHEEPSFNVSISVPVTRRALLCCEAAEMDFIEDDARGVIDSP
jgi:hypothetical protein